jgi:thiol:disulfide interchange protein DsbD
MGMGIPLLIIGTLGGKWLPRAGAWMDTVKAVFGVALLGVAIWMLERILPGPVVLLLWATLFLCSAVYMGALDSLSREASGWRRLSKGLGLVFAVYGVLLLIGAATGGDDMLRPLHELQTSGDSRGNGVISGAVAAPHVSFQRVRGTEGLDKALQQASAAGKPVLLDFYADWCVECKRMERYTFEDPKAGAALAGVVLLQADVTENDDIDQALLERFSLLGPPALLFFDTKGQEMRGWRFVGYKEVDEFVTHVNGAYEGMK